MRATRQREAIRSALRNANGFRTAQELHDELREAGQRVGLTTVYRTLQALADGGHIDVLRTDDGESIYRVCERSDHHHHLVCRRCGRSVEIDSRAVEDWANESARRHGFKSVTHTAELYGFCADCVSDVGD